MAYLYLFLPYLQQSILTKIFLWVFPRTTTCKSKYHYRNTRYSQLINVFLPTSKIIGTDMQVSSLCSFIFSLWIHLHYIHCYCECKFGHFCTRILHVSILFIIHDILIALLPLNRELCDFEVFNCMWAIQISTNFPDFYWRSQSIDFIWTF